MNWSGKALVGLLLLFVGGSLLLSTLGIHLGGLIGLALSALLIIYGYSKIQNGQKFFGGVVLALGTLILIGKSHLFIGILVSGAIIYFGYRLIKCSSYVQKADSNEGEVIIDGKGAKIESSFDDEWERIMEKK
ncbi:LiaF transmembrane domain-containing protein [Bacillus sp. FJAT-45350]|uniref:LiaF transmembrane domain-containing protein n=1 Tax=Bacillus sp. FJAT-45350 TaxID=2011014 RepID=UPI000BB75E5B|nr:hypothetical protein [Bacillus sp. FJAT-45350]